MYLAGAVLYLCGVVTAFFALNALKHSAIAVCASV